jgi:cytosine/uracil/thiamine/allantoin permease
MHSHRGVEHQEPAGMRTSLSNNNIALDLPSSHSTHTADNQAHHTPVVLSPRLHNKDLAPTKAEGRRWGRYSIFALWTNDVHNIANYSFAIGLYALGLGGWQILLSLGIGAALVYFFMNLSGYMGQKTGVPFPVISRISFGIHGAQIPALIRAVIAIAWFGIQTYLASVVFRVLLTAVHPGFADYDHNSILGLSTLGWVCFVAIWFVQLAILAYGMEMVRRYEAFAGPVILLTVAALATWMYTQADATIAVLILPWNLYNSPLVIVYFLSGLGALLGLLYGVIMVDYWLVRKGQVNVPQLYSEDPNGAYYYSRGVNLRAVAAFIPAALIAIVLALVPGFHSVSPFSWLIGAGIAGMLYLIIAKRQPHYADVSGEAIAVDNVSH